MVIDGKVAQGSKNKGGQRWLERRWTITATYSEYEKSLLDVMRSSLEHVFRGSVHRRYFMLG
ncbi:hypothetical protein [Roseiconus lacunae]|uniref:Uncharacterized protein n=1 Tax=Roseiconus lacunae TaxID=2605694 RepID=A0ABT7PHH4_9BACT|nr:hypothetical protein [Roseiconus lacunae]MDM4015940.1 hypothetical protein [Roseiconus lacunae]